MEAKSVEEALAKIEIWKYAFGFTPIAVVKCAIELQIADTIETHGGAMSLPDLSAALGCSPSVLSRIMRYLMHRGFFKQTVRNEESSTCYIQTPLSRLLMRNGENNMAAFILMESSPIMLGTWHRLKERALTNEAPLFPGEHHKDLWEYASTNPSHNKLFNDAMSCHARLAMQAIVDHYPEVFKGVESLVDVGGGDGTALRTLIKSCPWIHGINFDLPHVVSIAPRCDGIEYVDGNMFEVVPKANACFFMCVLHDWSDDECIHILNKCREVIPKEIGKVIIAEAVIDEGDEDDKYTNVRLDLDMVMLAHTEKGKERTIQEWDYVIKSAGFSKFTVKQIQTIVSVIEVYP